MTDASLPGQSIAPLLTGYSIEINPGDSKVVAAATDRLPPGTEVYLTWIPDSDPMEMVGVSARFHSAGLIPVPHIGARHLNSSSQLDQLAASLAGAGVDRVLVVGGDRRKPAGPFGSSLAVMQTGIFRRIGIRRIAVAGFPEGNPNISTADLHHALLEKSRFARGEGIELSIVTQFCFTAQPITAWLREIRNLGIGAPVRIGLAGPAGLVTLMRYAVRCGIGNSMHVLTQHPSFAKLLTEKGPAPIIQDLAAAHTGSPTDSGIAGLHFFVFGGFNKTVDWIHGELSK